MTTTSSDTEQTELADLEQHLRDAGVDFSPDTSLEGLHGLANLLASNDGVADSTHEITADPPHDQEPTIAGDGITMAEALDRANDAQEAADRLFQVDEYADPTLALPPIDGQQVDRIALSFTGTIMLDRNDKNHVALYKRLVTGGEHELWVNGTVTGLNGKKATNRDGDLDVMVGERKIKIDTIRILGAEDLAEARLELASQARDAAENQNARDRLPSDA